MIGMEFRFNKEDIEDLAEDDRTIWLSVLIFAYYSTQPEFISRYFFESVFPNKRKSNDQ
jgi:hypothetical protein